MDTLISALVALFVSLFSSQSIQVGVLSNNQVTILFTGDIMLGRSVMGAAIDNNDSFYPFRKTSDFLKNADLTFSNLENPIVQNCPRHVGGFKFCTNYEIAKGLPFAGIDIVTLANNHTTNYGQEGFTETKTFLKDNGVEYVGVSNLVVKEIRGTKYGFLGFNYTFSTTGLNKDLELIKTSDPQVNVLIVGPHWGEEYKSMANTFQASAAKKMIEAGADVVIGHHPHWVQNKEVINGKPVYYSLGNFIFDQMWSEETKKGLLVKMTFEGSNLINTEEFKTYTPVVGQPEIVN